MSKSMRDINEVESVLENLPKIYDQRSDQAVFLKLNEAMDLQTKKQNQFRRIFAVAMVIFMVITSAIFFNDRFDGKRHLSVSKKDEMKAQEVALRDEDDAASNYYNVSVHTEATAMPIHDVYFDRLSKYSDISAALESMRQGEANAATYTAIPESVQFEKIEEENGQLLLTFSDETILKNNKQYEMVISAILSTVKGFDYQTVRFQNSDVDVVGPYNLKEAIAVPGTPDSNEFK